MIVVEILALWMTVCCVISPVRCSWLIHLRLLVRSFCWLSKLVCTNHVTTRTWCFNFWIISAFLHLIQVHLTSQREFARPESSRTWAYDPCNRSWMCFRLGGYFTTHTTHGVYVLVYTLQYQKTHLFQLEKHKHVLSTKISDSKCFVRLKDVFPAPVRATALGGANVVARVCTAFGPVLVSWRNVFFGSKKRCWCLKLNLKKPKVYETDATEEYQSHT